jgi:Pyruvate:ferredoxin oxidoreductase and related 2-oxoacid:ferredoxin oxidoreductases, beta subunit
MNEAATLPEFKPADYKTDLKPVWCAGCGDFGVLTGLYRALTELQVKPWETVVVSGIGCSSRLPGYVDTFGVNSLHGRALPLAAGVKVVRPDLTVIAVGGDGDGLAIGGNHFMHAARRNLDVTYLIMDNEIYGLTKGQAAHDPPATRRSPRTTATPSPRSTPASSRFRSGRLGSGGPSRATSRAPSSSW